MKLIFFIAAFIVVSGMAYAKELGSFVGATDVITVAGSGRAGISDGLGVKAEFLAPVALAQDPKDGSIVVADSSGQRIRRISISGAVTTVAGNGAVEAPGFSVNPGYADGPVDLARFHNPSGVVVLKDGAVIVSDTGNFCLRKIANGVVSTIAGIPGQQGSADGSSNEAVFSNPRGLAVGPDGVIYIADGSNGIRVLSGGKVSTLPISAQHSRTVLNVSLWADQADPVTLWYATPMGIGRFDVASQNTTNWDASLPGVDGLAALGVSEVVAAEPSRGAIYFSDLNGVRRLLAGDNSRSTEGVGGFADGPAQQSRFFAPAGLTLGSNGKVFVADRNNRRIRELPLINKRFHLSDGGKYPQPNPAKYRVVYVSNSFAYNDTMWDDSIEGRLETYLNKNRSTFGIPRTVQIDAVRSGALGIKPQSEYIREILGQGTIDLVIWSVNSHAFLADLSDFAFALPDLSDQHQAEWKSDILGTEKQLSSVNAKLVLISQPFGTQVGPTEDYFLKELSSIGKPTAKAELQRVPDYAYDFNLKLEAFLKSIGVSCYVAGYPQFMEFERGAHVPLYIPDDFHFSPNGNAFYATVVEKAVTRCAPWKK